MHIAIIGGGPAGLFFARRVKQLRPDWQVELYEQNARDATYGFGVGLLGRSLEFIGRTDPLVLEDLLVAGVGGSSMGFVHKGETVVVNTGPAGQSAAIERIALLHILQSRAEEVGVELHFNTAIEDIEAMRSQPELLRTVGVLVGADGFVQSIAASARTTKRNSAQRPIRSAIYSPGTARNTYSTRPS